jgi:hypothetical protein
MVLFRACSLIALTTMVVAGGRPDIRRVPGCSKQPADLLGFLKAMHSNGVPFDDARDFTSCSWAVPQALAFLDPVDGAAPPFVENVVLTLGILGHIEAISALKSFLESPPRLGPPSYEAYIAKMIRQKNLWARIGSGSLASE